MVSFEDGPWLWTSRRPPRCRVGGILIARLEQPDLTLKFFVLSRIYKTCEMGTTQNLSDG